MSSPSLGNTSGRRGTSASTWKWLSMMQCVISRTPQKRSYALSNRTNSSFSASFMWKRRSTTLDTQWYTPAECPSGALILLLRMLH